MGATALNGAALNGVAESGGGDPATTALTRLVARTQAQARIPALSVAIHRADRPPWTFQVGTSGRPAAPLDAGTRFRIGSVTKTFTAVLVMQCRDDGLLGLDDPLGKHLDVPAHGELTVARLLSHTSGLQREPYGDVWESLLAPGTDQLLDELARAERVLPAGRRFHYSNLAFALLGLLVAGLRGGTWGELLADRITRPLGLTTIGEHLDDRCAVGYLVDAYSDHARCEPPADFGAVGPAGQLWSNAADLARWAAFLADPEQVDPAGSVLASSTVEEMRTPLTTTEDGFWPRGFGLGLMLAPQGGRTVHVGHDGAMPGFLAGAYGRREDADPGLGCGRVGDGTPRACAAAVLGSSGTATATVELPHQLLQTAVREDPAQVPAWQIGPPAPPEYRSLLGRWWSEGSEFVFVWRDGAVRAYRSDDPQGRPPAVFAPTADPVVLRTASGREAGELLRLTRDAEGVVTRMHWATYLFSRAQLTFDAARPGDE
jgi:CubicO group peptidase (beta-lactamase class C family)